MIKGRSKRDTFRISEKNSGDGWEVREWSHKLTCAPEHMQLTQINLILLDRNDSKSSRVEVHAKKLLLCRMRPENEIYREIPFVLLALRFKVAGQFRLNFLPKIWKLTGYLISNILYFTFLESQDCSDLAYSIVHRVTWLSDKLHMKTLSQALLLMDR